MRQAQKHVLLLDDDPDIRVLLRKILETQGFKVEEAATVAAALSKARERPPHLMVTDLEMPPESGFDFIVAAKSDPTLKTIPLIVLSNLRDRETVFRATTLGASDYVLKPIKAPLFLQKVRKALLTSDFAKYEFDFKAIPKIQVEVQGIALSLGEAALRVETSLLLEKGESLRIEGRLLEDIGITGCLFKTTRRAGRSESKGRFVSEISIIGAKPEVVKAVRRRVRGNA